MYTLEKITPMDSITNKDRRILNIAYEEALSSDFKTFRLGAVVRGSKGHVCRC